MFVIPTWIVAAVVLLIAVTVVYVAWRFFMTIIFTTAESAKEKIDNFNNSDNQ